MTLPASIAKSLLVPPDRGSPRHFAAGKSHRVGPSQGDSGPGRPVVARLTSAPQSASWLACHSTSLPDAPPPVVAGLAERPSSLHGSHGRTRQVWTRPAYRPSATQVYPTLAPARRCRRPLASTGSTSHVCSLPANHSLSFRVSRRSAPSIRRIALPPLLVVIARATFALARPADLAPSLQATPCLTQAWPALQPMACACHAVAVLLSSRLALLAASHVVKPHHVEPLLSGLCLSSHVSKGPGNPCLASTHLVIAVMSTSKTTVSTSTFPVLVAEELTRARASHPTPMNSAHEAYAVVLEELEEFWEQVKRKKEERHLDLMLHELTQAAAMLQRCAEDLSLCAPAA